MTSITQYNQESVSARFLQFYKDRTQKKNA